MSRAQHTPGPWAINPDKPWEILAHTALTCTQVAMTTMGDFPGQRGDEVIAANAALIAAAPDMLAALEYARARLIETQGSSEPAIDAAITKARGGAQ